MDSEGTRATPGVSRDLAETEREPDASGDAADLSEGELRVSSGLTDQGPGGEQSGIMPASEPSGGHSFGPERAPSSARHSQAYAPPFGPDLYQSPTPRPSIRSGESVRRGLLPVAAGPSSEDSGAADGSVDPGTPFAPEEVVSLRATDQEILDKSRALWRDNEPDDPSDPVPHTDCQTLQAGRWLVFGASRRGLSHAHDAKYREDSFRIEAVEGWVLAVVADGTGSQPLARVGANLASRAAISHLASALDGTHGLSDTDTSAALRVAISGALAAALVPLVQEATRRGCSVNELSTTLVLLVCQSDSTKPWVATGQVGDGGVAARMQSGDCVVLGQADHGQFGGETLFLTSRESQLSWPKRANAYRVTEPIDALFVASDGVMDDFLPPFGQLAPLFDAVAPLARGPVPEEQLLEWLAYERRSSFDDRTLVAIVQQPADVQ